MARIHVFLAVLLLCAAPCGGSKVQLRASVAESFTQNAICRQNNCVNPLFPGLLDLGNLDTIAWQCTNHSTVSDYINFCGEIVNYSPALPSPNATSRAVKDIVKEQDDAAATMFYYHLSGLGYEAKEFRDPGASGDECVQSIWRMVCFTYFPKAQAGCSAGQPTSYLRPCRNSCESYVAACSVECCDESVQCVFQHTVSEGGMPTEMVQTGYTDVLGPAAVCTGAGHRSGLPIGMLLSIFAAHAVFDGATSRGEEGRPSSTTSRRVSSSLCSSNVLSALVMVFCALFLQGCDVDVPHHNLGNWRLKPDYLVAFEFVAPGQPASSAILNSCSEGVAQSLQCSGRGYCKAWSETERISANALSFCECDRDWTDPECRTRRKSQVTTFLLALFGGFFGLDYFYLGWPWWGAAKLCTLGGCGFWWVLDIVRTGSGPVYAFDYRVANDLPHWVYVLSTVTLFGLIGFAVAIESYLSFRKRKREDVMKLQESEESRHLGKMDEMLDGPRYRAGVPSPTFNEPMRFSGYGATLPSPLPNAGVPYAVPSPPGQAGRFAGPYGPSRIS
mmetsp:Transcript_30839/g.88660  ORF Transcript_30839/g.88660 Transcript_30839/m.88660 type:complete len:559 (-) Transcript_30839:44-1720(-)